MPLDVDAAAKGDKRKGWDGEDRRWTECNGTSNSNMPAISRSDALMRDAPGDEAERWREREGGNDGTAGRVVFSRRMKV